MKSFSVAGPSITEKEIEYVKDAVATAWYADANKYNSRFENAFADHCSRKHAVALPSCTSAIHLTLLALGVGPGDQVLVPDVTWIASAAPILYVGASPIFVDIDPQTWCIDVDAFERAITPRTKAAIIVDLYGSMPNWDRLIEVANRHDVVLIEDAAEAIGSRWKDRPAGSFGTFSTFSFHGSKTLTTGEGGMLVLDDDALLERVLQLRDHGRKAGDTMFFNDEVGWKYKMSSLQAALGLAQLERIDELVLRKREIFSLYSDALQGWSRVSLNPDVPGLFNSYWMSTVLLDPSLGISKEELIPRLQKRGIHARPLFYPLSAIPAFRDTSEAAQAREINRVAYATSSFGVNLPSALNLIPDDIRTIADHLKDIVEHWNDAA